MILRYKQVKANEQIVERAVEVEPSTLLSNKSYTPTKRSNNDP